MLERFMSKVSPCPNTGCWLWDGSGEKRGYAFFRVGPKVTRAHRVSYALFCSEIPDGKDVLHSCDVRCCVNPEHLFLGDDAANVADRQSKQRQARGLRNAKARLDSDKVAFIRASDLKHTELAKMFGVSAVSILKVRQGKHWSHV